MITTGSTVDPECIIPQQLNDSRLIFDDDNATCQRLDIEAGVASIKLEVKPSCVNTTEVSNQSAKLKYKIASCQSEQILPYKR